MNGTAFSGWVSLGNAAAGWQVAGTGSFHNTGSSDILWQNTVTGNAAFGS
jgi:hypothetical protein